jgi:hypothetical protein
LLTTGRTLAPADSAASQVVNILDSSSTCQNIPDYPIAVHQTGGGILDNVPIVCGGGSDDHGMQSTCYKLDKDTIQWTLLTNAFPAMNREACNQFPIIPKRSFWMKLQSCAKKYIKLVCLV